MTIHLIAGLVGGFPVGWLFAALLAQRSWAEAMEEKMCSQCGKHIAHFCAGCTTAAILKSRPVRGENGKFKKRETLSV